jgi:hypothetical protein
MTWTNFPFGFIVAFLGVFGCCALIAWALVK